ncbi:hypothetical protein H0E84_09515 [Luteimonas sp. SJ-92]|uniref:Uncharacterized protein n=1 Tax=Luteimonas salinisoli TaxID=2752307 RepID=A0A853JCZ6_9GAMM|nr:hypothetical protein [Luteimonas salinisoli]NZA26622.1 hypothetical protein [Luteimonas salinisoli]
MSVEFDSRITPADSQPDETAAPARVPDQSLSPENPAPSLSLPEAASMLEEGLCRLVARGLPDDAFWSAFSALYSNLAAELAGPERTRLAYHADYALARMGLPVWTVMQQTLQVATRDTLPQDDSPPVAAAA